MTTPAIGVGDWTPTIAAVPADVLINQESAQVIGAVTQVTYGPFTLTSPAYSIAFDAVVNAAATVGIHRVEMIWTDSATGLVVGMQNWYPTGASASPGASNSLTVGRGPTEADTLTIKVANEDPLHSSTIDLTLWQSSRVVTRHDWRTVAQGNSIVNFTNPKINVAGGMLGWETAFSITASNFATWQCGLYAGQAQLQIELSAVTSVSITVEAAFNDVAAAYPVLVEQNPPTGIDQTFLVSLPRCPVVVQINNGSAATLTGAWSLVIQEFAS